MGFEPVGIRGSHHYGCNYYSSCSFRKDTCPKNS
ncbi:hypothetical protein [Methanoplanus endosymbiosus]